MINKPGPGSLSVAANPGGASEYGIALGSLDEDPGVRAEFHIFVADKAPWYEITDDLPRHDGYPPRR